MEYRDGCRPYFAAVERSISNCLRNAAEESSVHNILGKQLDLGCFQIDHRILFILLFFRNLLLQVALPVAMCLGFIPVLAKIGYDVIQVDTVIDQNNQATEVLGQKSAQKEYREQTNHGDICNKVPASVKPEI